MVPTLIAAVLGAGVVYAFWGNDYKMNPAPPIPTVHRAAPQPPPVPAAGPARDGAYIQRLEAAGIARSLSNSNVIAWAHESCLRLRSVSHPDGLASVEHSIKTGAGIIDPTELKLRRFFEITKNFYCPDILGG